MLKKKQSTDTGAADSNHAPSTGGMNSSVLTNGAWFKRGFYLSLLVNLFLAATLALFGTVTVLAQIFTEQTTRFAALTKDRKVIEIQTYDVPVSSEQGVVAWYMEAVMDSLDLDAAHWKRDLERAKRHFDTKAFSEFVVGLDNAGYIDYIRKNKLILRAGPSQPARVMEKGIDVDDVYFWRLEIPVKLSFETGRKNVPTQDLLIEAVVKRADFVHYDRGLKITQIFMKDYR